MTPIAQPHELLSAKTQIFNLGTFALAFLAAFTFDTKRVAKSVLSKVDQASAG